MLPVLDVIYIIMLKKTKLQYTNPMGVMARVSTLQHQAVCLTRRALPVAQQWVRVRAQVQGVLGKCCTYSYFWILQVQYILYALTLTGLAFTFSPVNRSLLCTCTLVQCITVEDQINVKRTWDNAIRQTKVGRLSIIATHVFL